MKKILLLGAEKQAAVSVAQAWPELQFTFVTDRPIIDGWDLPNVRIVKKPVSALADENDNHDLCIPLCPKWILPGLPAPKNRLNRFDLKGLLGFLASKFADMVIPVSNEPLSDSSWILKGDRWHRPDAVMLSMSPDIDTSTGHYDCGEIYQQYFNDAAPIIAVGNRSDANTLCLAILEVHRQTFGREDFLLAGETITNDIVLKQTVDVLEAFDHRGFFTLNWLKLGDRYRLSSFRPVPKGVFGVLKAAQLDVLRPLENSTSLAKKGIKYVAKANYSNYKRLT